MNTLRRIGLSLAVVVFSSCLSLLVFVVGAYAVFGTPDILKGSLRESGLYTVLLQGALSPGTAASGEAAMMSEILTPSLAQQTVERLVDGAYDWAQGKTSTLSFNQTGETLTNGIAAALQQRVSQLPPCPDATPPPATSEDVLALTCLPPGVSATMISEKIRTQLAASGNAAGNTTAQEAELANQLAFVPVLYKGFQIGIYVIPAIIVLCALGIVFWSGSKRAGAKRMGWILVTAGLLQVFIIGLGVWLLHQAAVQSMTSTVTLQGGLLQLVDRISLQSVVWWMGVNAIYLLVGLCVLLLVYGIKNRAAAKSVAKHERIDSEQIK